MKLRFDPHQPHQRAAMEAVLAVLAPAPRRTAPARIEVGGTPVVSNAALPPLEVLDARAREVQARAELPRTGVRFTPEAPFPQLGVEMETGTGKTYVFLRLALALAARAGLRKFVVVVPSVAIREGVLKTLQSTREHFTGLYPELEVRFFGYQRGRLGPVVRFARSAGVELAVLTVDAFNKAHNLLRRPHDACGGESPLALWRATRPVLLLDEPHHLETPLRVAALQSLDPCLALRFGATHRRLEGLVHRLSAAQAHRAGLVKSIEVEAVATGGESDAAAFSAQLRATIRAHLQRQVELRPRGVKVLSLVFLDRVSDYAGPDPVVRRLFDEHFEALRHLDPEMAARSADSVRAAYFARDRSARWTDSQRGTTPRDADAYALIMRDKERLLSFEEPTCFVFSHSALREGWDNPNVFQICTLATSTSAVKKRQEIGRGIRLCVDAQGRRVTDPSINVLRVIANGSYEAYVRSLQAEDEAIDPADRVTVRAAGGADRSGARPRPEALLVRRAGWRDPDAIAAESDARLGPPQGELVPVDLPDLVDDVRRVCRGVCERAPARSLVSAVLHRMEHKRWFVLDPARVAVEVGRAFAAGESGSV